MRIYIKQFLITSCRECFATETTATKATGLPKTKACYLHSGPQKAHVPLVPTQVLYAKTDRMFAIREWALP